MDLEELRQLVALREQPGRIHSGTDRTAVEDRVQMRRVAQQMRNEQ